jgi:hypothetical protein
LELFVVELLTTTVEGIVSKRTKAVVSEEQLAQVKGKYAIVFDIFNYHWIEQLVRIWNQIAISVCLKLDTTLLTEILHVTLVSGRESLN